MTRYEQAVQDYMAHDKARYKAEVAKAKADAEAQWKKEYPAKLREETKILSMQVASLMDNKGMPLSADARKSVYDKEHAQIVTKLEQEGKERVEMAASMVQLPMSEEAVRAMYSFLQGIDDPPMETPETLQAPDLNHAFYRLSDGRVYSVEAQEYVPETKTSGIKPIDVPGGTQEDLKTGILEFYKLPVPAFMCSKDELFARLRDARDKLLAEYDRKAMQFERENRIGNAARAKKELNEWDLYAQALCELPEQADAPWDGGGPNTPWPPKPQE